MENNQLIIPTKGFFVRRIEVRGSGKDTVTIEFEDGLNIVFGPSDTGKSYVLQVLDFLLGAKEPPKKIPEADGYDTFIGVFHSRKRNVDFAIQRTITSKKVYIDDRAVSLKKNSDEGESLDRFFLEEVDQVDSRILKNSKGESQRLSSRNLAHLSIINENRISQDFSPQCSDNYNAKTSEKSVIKLLLAGSNYEGLEVNQQKRIERAKVLIPALNELKDQLQGRLDQELFSKPEEIKSIKETLERQLRIFIPEVEINLEGIEPQVSELKTKLATRQALQAKLESYLSSTTRFRALDDRYSTDIDRLQLLLGFVKSHHKLLDQPCPICGGQVNEDSQLATLGPVEQDRLEKAMLSELDETKVLQQDLLSVMNIERDELENTEKCIKELDQEINKLFQTVSQLYSATIKPRMNDIQTCISQLEQSNACLALAKQIEGFETRIKEEQSIIDSQPEVCSPDLTIKEAKPLVDIATVILQKWGFDASGIQFSDKSQDLTIDGSIRSSHGKGVRSLGSAAFLVGLMQACLEKQSPHYSFIAIDSPLSAYKDVPTEADLKGLPQSVETRLYNGFENLNGQIIVFDNTPPPADIQAKVIKFSKTDKGRYGFFPKKRQC